MSYSVEPTGRTTVPRAKTEQGENGEGFFEGEEEFNPWLSRGRRKFHVEKCHESIMSVMFFIMVTKHLTRSNLKNGRFVLARGVGRRMAGAPRAGDDLASEVRCWTAAIQALLPVPGQALLLKSSTAFVYSMARAVVTVQLVKGLPGKHRDLSLIF